MYIAEQADGAFPHLDRAAAAGVGARHAPPAPADSQGQRPAAADRLDAGTAARAREEEVEGQEEEVGVSLYNMQRRWSFEGTLLRGGRRTARSSSGMVQEEASRTTRSGGQNGQQRFYLNHHQRLIDFENILLMCRQRLQSLIQSNRPFVCESP